MGVVAEFGVGGRRHNGIETELAVRGNVLALRRRFVSMAASGCCSVNTDDGER
jgi:hypothetical protein